MSDQIAPPPRRTVADHNQAVCRYITHRWGIQMSVRKYKIIKSALVSILLVAFGMYSIGQGSDPTTTGYLVLVGLLLINGIEFSELFAVLHEARDRSQSQSENDDR